MNFKKGLLFLMVIVIIFTLLGCSGGDNSTSHTLTVGIEGEGSVDPSGGSFKKDQVVQLTAIPESGWVFNEWKGGISSSENPYDLIMTDDISVIASFLKVNNLPNIEINGEGIVKEKIVSYTNESLYQLELTAVADTGWIFAGWDIEGTLWEENPLIVSVDSDIRIKAHFVHETTGMLKIINSWGEFNTENYITYEAAIENDFPVFFFEPVDNYEPKAIALFEIEGENRGSWNISIETDTAEKKFYNSDTEGHGGNYSFPDNFIAFDITELLPLNNDDVNISITNDSGQEGSLKSFNIEIYENGYDADPTSIYDSQPSIDIKNNETKTYTLNNITALASLRAGNTINLESASRSLTPDDIEKLTQNGDENNLIFNGHGTGLNLFTREELEIAMGNDSIRVLNPEQVLNRLSNDKVRNSNNGSIDLSKSSYFPPIGDQGQKNSCVAWSMAYYMNGFYHARDNGWDFTGEEIETADQRKLFSPQFMYHLINDGEDSGSNFFDALLLLSNTGVSSLDTMPYSDQVCNTWPGEAAWREAPNSRIGGYDTLYYIDVNSYQSIAAIKILLEEGYLLACAVDAYQYNEQGVWTIDNYSATAEDLNHANTVVGYTE